MKVMWEVEDGYAGGSRPQSVEVPDDEIAECCDLKDAEKLIQDYVQEEFENTVSASIKGWDEIKDAVQKLADGPFPETS